MTETLTGIPVDVLFLALGGTLGALGTLSYNSVCRRLDVLERKSDNRGSQLDKVCTIVRLIAAKLNIPPPED